MSDNPYFYPEKSSDDIYFGQDNTVCLTDVVNAKASIDHNHDGVYATEDHNHDDVYATISHNHGSTYASASHTHSNYASSTHTHSNKADLVAGKVPISQIPNEVKEVRFANTIADRNAITDTFVGLTVIVVDATDDETVSTGSAWYVYTGYGWAKTAESESMDVVLEWANIQGKPSVFPPDTHTHDGYASVSDIESLQMIVNGKADTSHSHSEYATQESLDSLAVTVNGKADANHTHTNYASSTHEHDNYSLITHDHDEDYAPMVHSHTDYATVVALNTLETEVDGKADVSHTHDYASSAHTHTASEIGASPSDHNHDSDYADINHNHDDAYSLVGHNHNSNYAPISHSHDNYVTTTDFNALESVVDEKANASHTHNYASVDHEHDDYATVTALNELSSTVTGKANSSHTHDDRYYTETEMDSKLATKSDYSHNHNNAYDTKGSAANALADANTYTDSKINALVGEGASTTLDTIGEISSAIEDNQEAVDLLNSAISNKANVSDLNAHTNNKSNPHNVTLSQLGVTATSSELNYVDGVTSNIQTQLNNKASSSHNHDSVYYTETEVDSLLSGKANSSHTHSIANVTGLQSALDGKASTSHGTHVSYSTTAPVMDGTASVGTASTVARSDHKHPTDTTRASQTSLDSHTGNKSNPHGVTLAQLGLTTTASELNTLNGITATVIELNYMDGVTSNVQTQLNAKASSSHTHNYAGSSSAGGAATSANKLNTNAGDSNTPVYFANGVPVACTSLDLNTSGNAATATNVAWSGVTSKPSYYDAKAIKSITRSGTTFTYTCMDGTTGTFTQQDNNTTYNAVTTSENGLMTATDKVKLNAMELSTVAEVETYLGI